MATTFHYLSIVNQHTHQIHTYEVGVPSSVLSALDEARQSPQN